MGLLITGIIGLTTGALAWFQAKKERQIDLEDQDRRAHVLAYQVTSAVQDILADPNRQGAKELGSLLEGHRKLIGFAVYDAAGRMFASGKAIPELADNLFPIVQQVLNDKMEVSETVKAQAAWIHIFATRLVDSNGAILGALVVVHDVSHLEDRTAARLVQYAFWILIVSFLLMVTVVGITWMAYERPLQNLAQWMQRLRTDNVPDAPPIGLPVALLASESERLAASYRAIRFSTALQSRSAMHDQNVWTRERLRSHAINCLQGGQIVVASNREPYMHQLQDGKPKVITPAGGLVTALDPVLQACGGIWVAHGAGEADRATADQMGRITVPPSDPRYTLRRVWLSRDEEKGYYYGFSNEGFWPLCHLAHERPIFREEDWNHYSKVNQRFADTIIDEIGGGEAMVLVQDFHLALLPRKIKIASPATRVGIFWHIPWPNPEAFRICPWRELILQGMLGADLIGFHLQQYCNNFLDTVDRMIEARLDWDHFAVEFRGHRTLIRPFPISVEDWAERGVPTGNELQQQITQLKDHYKLNHHRILVGVDRIDYTKGLPERIRALDRFFEKYPQFRESVTFVQLGAPSRTHIRRYRELIAEVESLVDETNWKYQTDAWRPVRLLIAHHDAAAVHAFMQMAEVCIVSSLHDGMNLVAKEYVMAKSDGDGALVLSEFAGAAREMPGALIVNPYDIEQFADAIRIAVDMPSADRKERMARMRTIVEERNIYRWAGKFLTELAATRTSSPVRQAPDSALERV